MTGDQLFLDANVLFSAAYQPGAGVARLWKLHGVELVTFAYAAEEARVNLTSENQRERLAKLLQAAEMVTGASPLPHGIELPPKDLPILQAAIYARVTHLLTGDQRHFGRYFGRRLAGVLVLPPAEYFRSYLL
jgi:hypothetical protein